MEIKAIVFDIGGVLIDEPGFAARDILANKYGFSAKIFKEYSMRVLGESYKGKLAAKDFFAGLIVELGLDVSPSALVEDWKAAREKTSNIDVVVKETLDKLKENYLLGVLSNNTCLNEEISVRKNCYGPFGIKILSCDVGMKKPDREIYEFLARELRGRGIEVAETIFVDDRKENLIPAKELGMKVILFEDAEQMIRDLRTEGVEI